MAHAVGKSSKLAVSTDGISYTDVGGLTSVDSDQANDTADTSDFDSAGHKEQVYTFDQNKLSVSGHIDEADTGFDMLLTSLFSKTILYYRYRPETGSGKKQYVFQGLIESLKHSSPHDGVIDYTLDVSSTGAVTKSNQ
jgi:predicted secreted protein